MPHFRLDRNAMQELARILSPLLDDQATRKSTVTSALFGSSVLRQIDWSGSSWTFTNLLLAQLADYGDLDDGETALVTFVDACKDQLGTNKVKQLDEILQSLVVESQPGMSVGGTDQVSLPEPTNTNKRQHVFMSYSSVDRPLVSQIAEAIKQDGYPVWVDNISTDFDGYLVGGEDWQQGLANALNQAILVVLAVSPDSMNSQWVAAEIRRARETERPIIPAMIRHLDQTGTEKWQQLQLDQLHNRNLAVDYKQGLRHLLKDIGKYTKPTQLATSIAESQGHSRNEFIVELLEHMQQGDDNATRALCGLLRSENTGLVSSVLRRLKTHPTAKKLPSEVVNALIDLQSHPDALVAGWSNTIIQNNTGR